MSGYNFTDDVRRGLQAAREEAFRLRHDEVQPIHILLGLLRRPGDKCTAALKRIGVETSDLSQVIAEAAPAPSPNPVGGPDFPYTSAAKRVLELSMQEAHHLRHSYVAPEHLLLGVLREEGKLAKLLEGRGVTLDGFRAALRDLGPSEQASSGERSGYTYWLTGSPRSMKWMSILFFAAGPVAWLALVVAVLALILAIRAQP